MRNKEREIFTRSEMILGSDAMDKLASASVLVCGIGGVGSFAAEALARSGIGRIGLADNDVVSPSNLNRQLVALRSTIGKYKVDVMGERIADINESCIVERFPVFLDGDTIPEILARGYDYVVDAIDTVGPKLTLICTCHEKNIPIISALGTGNKLDPSAFEITDISKTSVCPLARVVRYELKKRGVAKHTVLFSREIPIKPTPSDEEGRKRPCGSTSFTPPVAGMLLARHVILSITGK